LLSRWCRVNLAVSWTTDFFLCITNTTDFTGKSKHKIECPNIGSSKVSFKAVLLHNGNKHLSIPLANAVHMKETYASIQGLLGKKCYENHQWNVCADLKVVVLLTGLQGGYAKFCCFPCEWDSRARERHCHVKQWPLRGEMILDQKNVAHRTLLDKTKIYLPPLHIKLGLIKIFVKTMNKVGEGFDYLRQTFPHVSEAKTKEGIFVGPQVEQPFQDLDFNNKLNAADRRDWVAFENVCHNIWGNKKFRKLSRNRGGATSFTPCLGVQHVVDNLHICTVHQ